MAYDGLGLVEGFEAINICVLMFGSVSNDEITDSEGLFTEADPVGEEEVTLLVLLVFTASWVTVSPKSPEEIESSIFTST